MTDNEQSSSDMEALHRGVHAFGDIDPGEMPTGKTQRLAAELKKDVVNLWAEVREETREKHADADDISDFL